jgi:serine/threonine protein kinase
MSDQVEQLDRLRTALADRYRIERRLGEGGMATVYLAEDLKHHCLIARGTETSSYPQFPIPWHNPQEDRYEAHLILAHRRLGRGARGLHADSGAAARHHRSRRRSHPGADGSVSRWLQRG